MLEEQEEAWLWKEPSPISQTHICRTAGAAAGGGGVSQSLPGPGSGVGYRQLFNPYLCTQEPEHPGITGDLPPSKASEQLLGHRVTEQHHVADSRSCLGERERLALMPSQR